MRGIITFLLQLAVFAAVFVLIDFFNFNLFMDIVIAAAAGILMHVFADRICDRIETERIKRRMRRS